MSVSYYGAREAEMLVVFSKIGERRYAVQAKRSSFPDVEMNPAPGFDPRIPHDLMHLVVEAKLGLRHAVFGQLAAGGDAGTFHLVTNSDNSQRDINRLRKRLRIRGEKLLREGRGESAQSERFAHICWQQWLARVEAQRLDAEAKSKTKQVLTANRAQEPRILDPAMLEEICQHLDELSCTWSELRVGGSMTVRWPDLKCSP